MQSLRRLYLYAVTFISLEIVLWGSIGLGRAFVAGGRAGEGSTNQLAQALAFILVGIPVLLFHWWLAQRAALREPGERSALLRAIFLYGVLLATLLPVVNNSLALVDRLLAIAMGLDPALAELGGAQTFSDNLIAIALNALAAAYFYSVLRADWKAGPVGDDFAVLRRLFRYLAMAYYLGMAVIGVQRVLEYLLRLLTPERPPYPGLLTSGLALLLVGAPLWGFTWWIILRSWDEPAERQSALRWVALMAVTLLSAFVGLLSLILGLQVVLMLLLGMPSSEFLDRVSIPLSIGVPLALVWLYYRRVLRAEMLVTPQLPTQEAERRVGLQRVYAYLMALFVLAAAFLGLQVLLASLVELVVERAQASVTGLREQFGGGLAALLVGLPLWIWSWRPLVRGAAVEGEAGEQARRSLVRRGYLYLVLFAGVLGVMFTAGPLIYQLLRLLLGQPAEDVLLQSFQLLVTLLMFCLLLAYHYWVLRGDSRLTESLLMRRRAQYPVLVLAPAEAGFSEALVAALEQEAPGVPVAVHPIENGAPDETFSAARAVILPADLLTTPGEALRLWLRSFDGRRIVLTGPGGDWLWVPAGRGGLPTSARHAARLVRRLAEGETVAD